MMINRTAHTTRTTLAWLCAAALLAACSILPKPAPVQIWQPPSQVVASSMAGVPASLRVDTPRATGLLDAAGIVVMPTPGQLSTYAGARWSEAPALLVRARLVDAFMAAGLPAVTTDDDHFATDYTLSGDLRAFQTEYRAGSPVVVVRFDAQLRRGTSRQLLATHSFVVTHSPQGSDVAQVVNAFGAADDELAKQIVSWTVTQTRRTSRHPL